MSNNPPPTSPIAGILLAAGAGSRFGNGVNSSGGKLLHALDGVAIGVRAARNLQAAGLAVTAVVRPDSEALTRLLQAEGVAVTQCANAADGMGVSLAHVIAHTRDAAGWVVALADMPRIQPATIRHIVEALEGGALIAAPSYRRERGHPVGFSARLRDELLRLGGDEGARAVIKRHHAHIRLVETDDPGVIFDIDRQEDLPQSL